MRTTAAACHHHQDAHAWGRVFALLVLCVVAALLLSVDRLHGALLQLLAAAEPIILANPLAGAVVFVVLSALSAMLAFFSGVLLVPVAVYSWGQLATMVLLWLGWLLGGICTYAVGRGLGRPLVASIGAIRLLDFYRARLPERLPFSRVLLLQLALPSEIPGYLFGLMRVRFATYLAALALAEVPFAIGTVLIGESIVQQRGWILLVLGMVGIGISVQALLLLRRHLRRT